MSEIQPALTAEEWAQGKAYFRAPKAKWEEGYGIELSGTPRGKSMWVWDGSWALTIEPEARHGVAALCLHGQPFGFTREDVNLLRDVAYEHEETPGGGVAYLTDEQIAALRSAADRIAALLPPTALPETPA